MRQKNRFLIFLMIASLLFAFHGCDEKQNPSYDYLAIWNCHHENTWNFQTTKNKIVGLWEWKYIKCCPESTTPYQNGTEWKGLKIEFNADGTGILMNKDIVSEFTWDVDLVVNENGLYGFQTTPLIAQIDGRLLFCDNLMLCNSSYRDGADNFFRKIEKGDN